MYPQNNSDAKKTPASVQPAGTGLWSLGKYMHVEDITVKIVMYIQKALVASATPPRGFAHFTTNTVVNAISSVAHLNSR